MPLTKYIIFGDPFSPFLEGILNKADDDIINLRLMYAYWDGFKVDNESILPLFRNIFNFIIPIQPFSFLDTFGFSVILIFYRFKYKIEYLLILSLLITTSIMVFYSNFQSRWYLFLIIYILLQHNNLLIPKIIFKQFKYVIILCSSIILIFYFYFLSFVVFNSLTNSFLDTKKKTVYLYSEIKDLEKTTGDKLILTNTRSNYFSNKLIKYKYTNYFLQNANEITDINSIKYGFFSN